MQPSELRQNIVSGDCLKIHVNVSLLHMLYHFCLYYTSDSRKSIFQKIFFLFMVNSSNLINMKLTVQSFAVLV